MFENVAKTPKKTVKKTISLERTIAFLESVKENGARLSYGAFAGAAKALDKDPSRQIPAQRGSTLVKLVPEALQPFVCRKSGGYAKGVTWSVETPKDLEDRPVIISESLASALEEWEASLKS